MDHMRNTPDESAPPHSLLSGALLTLCTLMSFCGAGCRSPYRADQGALMGGAIGAGTGAIVGNAIGGQGPAGAIIGAGIGALSGGVIGSELDQIDAENRARIAATMGRQVQAGAIDVSEVVSMSRAGVAEELIANHVRIHGMNRPLTSQDLIYLQQQQVSPTVVQAMQAPPVRQASYQQVEPATVVVRQPPPTTVIVEDPWCAPPVYYYHGCHRPPPGIGWGFSYHN